MEGEGEREGGREGGKEPSGERTNVSFSAVADVAVGIDGGLSHKGRENLLVDAHSVEKRTEKLDFALAEDLDAEETVWKRVNHNVRVVELTRDRGRTVVALML